MVLWRSDPEIGRALNRPGRPPHVIGRQARLARNSGYELRGSPLSLVHFLLVCAGGAIGAGARYVVNVTSVHLLGAAFPWGTVIVNVVGSGLMGLIAGWLIWRGGLGEGARLFLATGVLGGFTTFSAFSLDTHYLIERGDFGLAALYVFGSIAAGLVALLAGIAVMRGLVS